MQEAIIDTKDIEKIIKFKEEFSENNRLIYEHAVKKPAPFVTKFS